MISIKLDLTWIGLKGHLEPKKKIFFILVQKSKMAATSFLSINIITNLAGHAYQVWFDLDWSKRSFRAKKLEFFILVQKSKMAAMSFFSINIIY